jgi:predicted transcriptional regulator
MSTTLSIRLPDDLADWIKSTAENTNQTQGEVVRQELEKARQTSTEKPWMKFAGAVSGPKDLSMHEGFDKR